MCGMCVSLVYDSVCGQRLAFRNLLLSYRVCILEMELRSLGLVAIELLTPQNCFSLVGCTLRHGLCLYFFGYLTHAMSLQLVFSLPFCFSLRLLWYIFIVLLDVCWFGGCFLRQGFSV